MPSYGRGEYIEKRAKWELVAWVVVLPVVGLALVALGLYVLWDRWRELTPADVLLQVVWTVLLGVVLGVGLPAVARKELRRRAGPVTTIGPGGPRRTAPANPGRRP
jgi:hypothetical protein